MSQVLITAELLYVLIKVTFVQFVNCISLEGIGVYMQVHDPYDSYDSWVDEEVRVCH